MSSWTPRLMAMTGGSVAPTTRSPQAVDDEEASALGVMSQGEQHSLALPLFLPGPPAPTARSTSWSSPTQCSPWTWHRSTVLAQVLHAADRHRGASLALRTAWKSLDRMLAAAAPGLAGGTTRAKMPCLRYYTAAATARRPDPLQ